MYGAILGDIIGSAYEWNRIKKEDFELFVKKSKYTDDTAMTIATADAILNDKSFKECYLKWGQAYPNAGYGGKFRKWLVDKDPQPYNSFGNGSAMRVSPCAWKAKDLEEALKLAEESAMCTHDHEEGIKGAKATAAAIFMAREKKSKEEIKTYIEENFKYNLSRTVAEIRPNYKFDSSCQGSVPESIICFLEATSYEDTIRKAVSLGGDADTQACIAGSIAEAFYGGVPASLKHRVQFYLPKDMMSILTKFSEQYVK